MLREDTVFGPIYSRRLGSSLGINLLPEKGKICNFDCIYCECGWNSDGRDDTRIPNRAEVRAALENKLSNMLLEGQSADSITFSGDGEPTLNPDFAGIIEDTIALRDIYLPQAKISVLSNATRIHVPEVFEALRKVDNPILKIDAPSNELCQLINKPAPGYDVEKVLEALEKFEGDFVLQTMFLQSDDFDSTSDAVLVPWMDIVRRLKPRQVMAYTIARPTPSLGLSKVSESEMREKLKPLISEGFDISFYG